MNKAFLSSILWWLAPGVLAVLLFTIICGPTILAVTNIAWMEQGGGSQLGFDPATHYLAWVFFRNSDWSFPLGLNPDYGMSVANSIIYSDSIPLLAIPFKAFAHLLPEYFQYFGLWVLLCFILQSYLGWLIVRLVADDGALALAGTAFFAFSLPMIWRLYAHASLMGHFFVLAALYLLLARQVAFQRAFWLLLLALSSGVHSYLFFCVATLWGVYILRELLAGQWRTMLAHIGLALLTTTLALWQFGYFAIGRNFAGDWTSYGDHQIAVFALFDAEWWTYLPIDVPGPTNYEGFVYLGLGLILLAPVAMYGLATRRATLDGLRIDWILIATAATLTVYGLSHRIISFDGVYTVDMLNFLMPVGEVFRASGRLFWPVYYLLIAVIIGAIITALPRRWALTLLLCGFVIQVADTHAGWRVFSERLSKMRSQEWTNRLTDPFWDEAARRYRNILRYPAVNQAEDWELFAELAARHGLATNSVYLGRMDARKLSDQQAELIEDISTGRFDLDSLYIVDRLAFDALRDDPLLSSGADLFVEADGFFVVAPGMNDGVKRSVTPARTNADVLRPGDALAINAENAGAVLSSGWNTPAEGGSWSTGKAALVILRLERESKQLAFEMLPFMSESHMQQRLEVVINGQVMLSELVERPAWHTFEIDVSAFTADAAADSVMLRIEFRTPDAASPASLGTGPEEFDLGFLLQKIKVQQSE